MDNDQDIIDKATGWKLEEEETKRRADQLRHDRIMSRRGALKTAFLGIGLLLLLGGIGFGAQQGCASARQSNLQDAQTELEHQRALDKFYETTWVSCTEKLNLDECRAIQETGLHECFKIGEGSRHSGYRVEKCAKDRLDERSEMLGDSP